MTDYSEDGKRLNDLESFYLPLCNVNVITKIGFGFGLLKRRSLSESEGKPLPGAPYQLKVGPHWSPEIPYHNPEEFLTFHWFKHNLMCKDQPWICQE